MVIADKAHALLKMCNALDEYISHDDTAAKMRIANIIAVALSLSTLTNELATDMMG